MELQDCPRCQGRGWYYSDPGGSSTLHTLAHSCDCLYWEIDRLRGCVKARDKETRRLMPAGECGYCGQDRGEHFDHCPTTTHPLEAK